MAYYHGPMALFVLIAPDTTGMTPFQEAIRSNFPNEHFVISSSVWAVSALGISKDVSTKIIGENPLPGGPSLVVVSVSGYYGLAQNSIWEWFASKMSASNGR